MRNFAQLFGVLLLFIAASCGNAEENNRQNAQEVEAQPVVQDGDLSVATFAGGCFWCVEAVFERLKGVEKAVSGYAGGEKQNPSYKEVSAGATQHAEAVQVYYDPEIISFEELLEVFFLAAHDPTQLNRQGPDIGPQYRSIAFYTNQEEAQAIRSYIKQLEAEGAYEKPIVTEVEPLKTFYKAEAYHQDYYEQNPQNPYIQSVSRPKVEKFEKKFRDKLKSQYL